jgi:hypothetical protein
MTDGRALTAALAFLAAAGVARAEAPPDAEVLKKVYDPAYRAPEGFVKDHALGGPRPTVYFHQPGWYADDKAKARALVQRFLDQPGALTARTIEEEKETPRYFDFRAGPTWYRIHRPSYFAWQRAQIGGTDPELGTLKARPLDAEAVKGLAEYHWLLIYGSLPGAKVLRSEGREEDGKLVRVLTATTVARADITPTDQITVGELTYAVDKATGATTWTYRVLKRLEGKKKEGP